MPDALSQQMGPDLQQWLPEHACTPATQPQQWNRDGCEIQTQGQTQSLEYRQIDRGCEGAHIAQVHCNRTMALPGASTGTDRYTEYHSTTTHFTLRHTHTAQLCKHHTTSTHATTLPLARQPPPPTCT